jgi:hypothetical protein
MLFLTADGPAFAKASSFAKATADKTTWQTQMNADIILPRIARIGTNSPFGRTNRSHSRYRIQGIWENENE